MSSSAFILCILALSTVLSGCNEMQQATGGTSSGAFIDAPKVSTPAASTNTGVFLNSGSNSSNPISPNGVMPGFLKLGYLFSCFKDLNSYFYCFGKGIGATPTVTSWGSEDIRSLAISKIGGHVCYIKTDNSLSCFGDNAYGQVGLNFTTYPIVNVPNVVSPSTDPVLQIGLGYHHTCFTKRTFVAATPFSATTYKNYLYCFGDNTFGQLGVKPSCLSRTASVVQQGGHSYLSAASCSESASITPYDAKTFAVGADHTCMIDSVGAVYCWGYGGRLGDRQNISTNIPKLVTGPATTLNPNGTPLPAMKGLVAGAFHTCALTAVDGKIFCWGGNNFAQTSADQSDVLQKLVALEISVDGGLNPLIPSYVPARPLDAGINFIGISAGKNHTCAIKTTSGSRKLFCWGANESKQITGAIPGSTLPNSCSGQICGLTQLFPNAMNVDSVSVGDNHTCAVVDGDLKCWGNSVYMQAGIPSVQFQGIVSAPQTIVFGNAIGSTDDIVSDLNLVQ